MKKLIALTMMLLAIPVLAYADSDMCTTCYVVTPRITDSTNESLCYSDASCWVNLTVVANGTNLITDQALTAGDGCVAYGNFALTEYATEAENLVHCTGYCERGTLSGTFDCGNYLAGGALRLEVDQVEENQATAETNQQNRTATSIANDDTNTTTILAAITAAVTSIAQDVWEYTGGRFIDGY